MTAKQTHDLPIDDAVYRAVVKSMPIDADDSQVVAERLCQLWLTLDNPNEVLAENGPDY